MREKFIERRFSAASSAIIETANGILEEYETQGLVLTLRQLYYQFVARGLIPNKQSEYKRLGSIINDGRLAGLIDWSMMEDRTRTLRTISSWDSPASIVDVVARQYQEDLWASQIYRPEVWIEKDALVGVIERACRELRVEFFACRGYSSQSAQYEAGQRFRRYQDAGQTPVIFHFGDHDPSGIDMTRDNADRLTMFAAEDVDVRRLALTFAQVERYNPPPNPAKESDSRHEGYAAKFGNESWELDALDPTVIDALIRTNVESLIDRKKWKKAQAAEQENRDKLVLVSNRWDDVAEFVSE
jgi:hypothetical protein